MILNRSKFYLFCLLAVAAASCSPATTARIGPPVPPRPPDCDLEVLEGDATPSRPYRDVGMVELKNCQDYRTPPCSEWLRRAACELGGQVVYQPLEDNLGAQTGPVTFRILVAAYVGNVRGSLADDPVYGSRICDPPCGESEVCLNGTCRPSDCEEAVRALEKAMQEGSEDSAPDRCVE
jgi:hypothetical protein